MSSAAVRSGWVRRTVPNHQNWKGRESEVLGMNTYIHELVAWANQASVEFGKEIAQAARWPTQIAWDTLSRAQQARGVRLVIVLQVQIFIFQRKFSNLHDEKISAFSPGQALTRAGKEFFLRSHFGSRKFRLSVLGKL